MSGVLRITVEITAEALADSPADVTRRVLTQAARTLSGSAALPAVWPRVQGDDWTERELRNRAGTVVGRMLVDRSDLGDYAHEPNG